MAPRRADHSSRAAALAAASREGAGVSVRLPGLYFPWLTLYALIALGLWGLLRLVHADFSHILAGWALLLLACNELIATAFYGAWHYLLYARRAQRAQFKYNPTWPRERDDRFLFAQQTRSNVFWTLGLICFGAHGSYMILTLWAQAIGIAPVTTWQSSPVYCTVLLLALVFFHAVHFYVFHRLLHFRPLYRTVHYLHHQNVNPGPWSGLCKCTRWSTCFTSREHCCCGSFRRPRCMFCILSLWSRSPRRRVTADSAGWCWENRALQPTGFYHYLHHKFFRVNFGDTLPDPPRQALWHLP